MESCAQDLAIVRSLLAVRHTHHHRHCHRCHRGYADRPRGCGFTRESESLREIQLESSGQREIFEDRSSAITGFHSYNSDWILWNYRLSILSIRMLDVYFAILIRPRQRSSLGRTSSRGASDKSEESFESLNNP